jgi:hypothetical protein
VVFNAVVVVVEFEAVDVGAAWALFAVVFSTFVIAFLLAVLVMGGDDDDDEATESELLVLLLLLFIAVSVPAGLEFGLLVAVVVEAFVVALALLCRASGACVTRAALFFGFLLSRMSLSSLALSSMLALA